MTQPRILIAVLSLVLPLAASFRAPVSAETAAEIIARAEDNRRVENSTQTISMTLYDRAGTPRTQVLESRIKQGAGAVRSYARLIAPADKAGVQFLTVQTEGGPTEQYVSFPGAGVSRISGGSKRGSFLGSDFSYEDMELGREEDATHTLVGEEAVTVGGQSIPSWKIESIPKPELRSQYGRVVTWISRDGFVPRQISLFDTRGTEVKRMTVLKLARQDGVVLPLETEMRHLQKGTRTVIKIDRYRVNVPASDLPDAMFTPEWLESHQ